MTSNSEDPQDPHGLTFSRSYNTSQKFCLATPGSPCAMAVRELHVCTRLLCTKGSEKIGRRVGPISPILVQLVLSLSLSLMMHRERQSFLHLRCGYGQKLALAGDFYGTSYHGHAGWRMAENNNNTSTIYYCTLLPQTLLSSWRIGDFCSRCYVRVMYCSSNSLFAQHMHKTFEFTNRTNLQEVLCEVYVLLLLKQSIAQHFHKPLSSPRIGHFSSAADFMWGMCCCYSNNLLHNISRNPLSSPRIGN